MPACGGGAELDKPPSSAPPPTNQPAPPPTPKQITGSPTTAWELWISNKDNEDVTTQQGGNVQVNEQKDNTNGKNEATAGVAGYTIGEGGNDPNIVPKNDTSLGYFDPDSWGYRGEEDEEKGILDMIGFGGEKDENGAIMVIGSSGITMKLLCLFTSVVLAWTIII